MDFKKNKHLKYNYTVWAWYYNCSTLLGKLFHLNFKMDLNWVNFDIEEED